MRHVISPDYQIIPERAGGQRILGDRTFQALKKERIFRFLMLFHSILRLFAGTRCRFFPGGTDKDSVALSDVCAIAYIHFLFRRPFDFT